MNVLTPTVKTWDTAPDYLYFCPGCQCSHGIWITHANSMGAIWSWNGSLENPTFSPSFNVLGACHHYVVDGQIQFLGDCTHALAGQTVPMQPV